MVLSIQIQVSVCVMLIRWLDLHALQWHSVFILEILVIVVVVISIMVAEIAAATLACHSRRCVLLLQCRIALDLFARCSGHGTILGQRHGCYRRPTLANLGR